MVQWERALCERAAQRPAHTTAINALWSAAQTVGVAFVNHYGAHSAYPLLAVRPSSAPLLSARFPHAFVGSDDTRDHSTWREVHVAPGQDVGMFTSTVFALARCLFPLFDDSHVYSARWRWGPADSTHGSAHAVFDPARNGIAYMKRVHEIVCEKEGRGFVFVVDIRDFFGSLTVDLLGKHVVAAIGDAVKTYKARPELLPAGTSPEVIGVAASVFALTALRWVRHWGRLPVGVTASALLAELVMRQVDTAIGFRASKLWARFVDGYFVWSSTESAAKSDRERVATAIRSAGLGLNTDKSTSPLPMKGSVIEQILVGCGIPVALFARAPTGNGLMDALVEVVRAASGPFFEQPGYVSCSIRDQMRYADDDNACKRAGAVCRQLVELGGGLVPFLEQCAKHPLADILVPAVARAAAGMRYELACTAGALQAIDAAVRKVSRGELGGRSWWRALPSLIRCATTDTLADIRPGAYDGLACDLAHGELVDRARAADAR